MDEVPRLTHHNNMLFPTTRGLPYTPQTCRPKVTFVLCFALDDCLHRNVVCSLSFHLVCNIGCIQCSGKLAESLELGPFFGASMNFWPVMCCG
mmetsp:Transcript_27250/g.63281  ORF Transcript_27250/g.63281 Transcript_27250/m.63281 type:complete len:93 (-) Transcript_27250:108-386(-)